ncbi:MAG: TlpA disulfide reductase family protein [Mariniphaga sp.]
MQSSIKKTSYILIVLFLLVSCGKKSNFTISGQLGGGAGKTVYFQKILISNQSAADSVKIDKDGKFMFKGSTSTPTFYSLKLSKNSFITLLVDSAENAIINGSYKRFTQDYKVSGSVGSERLLDLDNRFIKAKAETDSLRLLYNVHKSDPIYVTKCTEWNAKYISVITDHSNYVTAFIKKNPFSLASVYALYQKWDESNFVVSDFQTMKMAASALYSVYPKNEQVIALYNNTLQLVKNENSKKLTNAIKDKAVNSPNIVLPDAFGNERNLWSLHGKYVLLHFWSAKDRASRIINPVLSEIYAKYKNKGLEIFMVSIDNDKNAWLNAIEEDRLTCINVGDMKGSVQALTNYNIQEIPYNYLLDKEGSIIGKNLKGPALDQTLSKILK